MNRTSSSRLNLAVGLVVAGAAWLVPGVASAQSANCPPGSWFCESAPAPAAGASAPAGQLQQLPPAGQPAPAPAAATAGAPAASNGQAPPVVIYQPGPPVVVVQGKSDKPPPYVYSPRDPNARPKREWGLNLHGQGAMIGGHNDTGMGGLGLGLRFRPHPVIAIEPSIDFYGGRDYQGNRRSETAFQINTLLFANPRAKVVQLYFPVGFGWSGARVQHDNLQSSPYATTSVGNYYDSGKYTYFGMQAGIGLEFRVARHFALNTDLRGFIRGRIDDEARTNPEFRDGTRATNSSGGGLFTVGMTFYF